MSFWSQFDVVDMTDEEIEAHKREIDEHQERISKMSLIELYEFEEFHRRANKLARYKLLLTAAQENVIWFTTAIAELEEGEKE